MWWCQSPVLWPACGGETLCHCICEEQPAKRRKGNLGGTECGRLCPAWDGVNVHPGLSGFKRRSKPREGPGEMENMRAESDCDGNPGREQLGNSEKE